MNFAMSRRQFVRNSLLATAAFGMKPSLLASPAAKMPPISIQLYSVRDDCARDFDAALTRLAQMGFAGVEFAGYHKYEGKPKELRQKLNALKLKAPATHLQLAALRGEALQKTIEFHQTVGCKFLIVPGDKDFTHPERSKALAETFNEIAAKLKPLGMYCGYHNHVAEFQKDDGKTYWEWFAERTSRDVVLQQDCGWSAAAGMDPAALIRRYPGRTKITHFKPTVVGKDPGKKAIFGQDSVDWPAVLAACLKYGGTEWITLEQEVYPDGKSPMECTEQSLAGLKQLMQSVETPKPQALRSPKNAG